MNLRLAIPEASRQSALNQQMVEREVDGFNFPGEVPADVVLAYIQAGDPVSNALRFDPHEIPPYEYDADAYDADKLAASSRKNLRRADKNEHFSPNTCIDGNLAKGLDIAAAALAQAPDKNIPNTNSESCAILLTFYETSR